MRSHLFRSSTSFLCGWFFRNSLSKFEFLVPIGSRASITFKLPLQLAWRREKLAWLQLQFCDGDQHVAVNQTFLCLYPLTKTAYVGRGLRKIAQSSYCKLFNFAPTWMTTSLESMTLYNSAQIPALDMRNPIAVRIYNITENYYRQLHPKYQILPKHERTLSNITIWYENSNSQTLVKFQISCTFHQICSQHGKLDENSSK